MILYDNRSSTNAIKVRFLLAELGVAAELRETPLRDKPAEYLDLHPFGLVPTLVDGALVITESNVALRYLAEREGRDDLRGEDPARRARIDNLMDTLSLELRPALWGVEEIEVYGLDVADEPVRRAALDAALDAFERLLDPEGPYVLRSFTIADCAIAGRCQHLERLGLADGAAPRLRRAVAAAHARAAWAAAA
ncbi:MAG: stringent starvation protein [Solirubrobacteraceae bacterium]|jgi:glutathione S-transferase|nr:stringent starvation protein [Solirubrobacteraceae bacterium]